MSLESVRVLDDAAATATSWAGPTTFDFTAASPGSFRVDFTVTDGLTDATGTARITVLPADAPPQLATAPVVAFVHPQEDATLDVFAAVSNPRAACCCSATSSRGRAGALALGRCGRQNHLRVSGTTATGASGRLGTVTLRDQRRHRRPGRARGGRGDGLPPAAGARARPDRRRRHRRRARRRADRHPGARERHRRRPGASTLNPARSSRRRPDALAFASGDLLRYLAPIGAGRIRRRVLGLHGRSAVARRHRDGARPRARTRRQPRAGAETLEGRVLSGQSTLVEFDGFGMDPDGDVVDARPDREPAGARRRRRSRRTASRSSTRACPGYRGQVSFRYRVVDALGETGEGTARIGVLDGQSNPSPITFTDYVQVQAGEGTPSASARSRTMSIPTRRAPAHGRASRPARDARRRQRRTTIHPAGRPHRLGRRHDGGDRGGRPSPATMSFLYDMESSFGQHRPRPHRGPGRARERARLPGGRRHRAHGRDPRGLPARRRRALPARPPGRAATSTTSTVALWGEPRGVTVDGDELRGEAARHDPRSSPSR